MTRTLMALGLLVFGGVGAGTQDTPKPADYYNPAWSPDSRSLVFESNKDGKFAVYTISIDGTGMKTLTSGTANDGQPSWSPDGRRIVFNSDRDGHAQLYLMNADGSDQTRLTNTANGDDFFASFSPDGQWILFGVQQGDRYDICVVRVDGAGRRQLTDSTRISEGPEWSSDGKRILFTQTPILERAPNETPHQFIERRNKAGAFVSILRDGSGHVVLTQNDVHDSRPHASRDGKTIYFTSTRDGAGAVYAMNADGSSVRRIVDAAIVPSPKVSPDGRWFAYAKKASGASGVYVYEIASKRERLVASGSAMASGK